MSCESEGQGPPKTTRRIFEVVQLRNYCPPVALAAGNWSQKKGRMTDQQSEPTNKCNAPGGLQPPGATTADVEADEIWAYVGMKQKTKNRKGLDAPELGDAWTFIGLESNSKLVLAWELGQRTIQTTDSFMEKLDAATAGRFQISTDGLNTYPESVNYHLGTRVDHGVIIKEYGTEGTEEERRYSPPSIIGVEKFAVHGTPEPERICTSYVERQNLTLRMQNRRLTRLTNAFSKKWENLRASLALHFATYNLVRRHSTLRMTPAMKAGLTNRFWGFEDLLTA